MTQLPPFRSSDESGEGMLNIRCLAAARRLLEPLRDQPEARPHLLVPVGSDLPQMPSMADIQAAAATLAKATECLAYQYHQRFRPADDRPLTRDDLRPRDLTEQDNDTPF